jgi:hypothetical protein
MKQMPFQEQEASVLGNFQLIRKPMNKEIKEIIMYYVRIVITPRDVFANGKKSWNTL